MTESLILLGFLGVFALFLVLREKEKVKKQQIECDQFIRNNPKIADADSKMFSIMFDIAKDVPPCQKCGWEFMQLWSEDSDGITYRCTSCKKTYNLDEQTTPNKIYDLRENLNHLYKLLEKIGEHDKDEGWKRLREDANYHDYFSLKKGTPYMRAIEFLVRGEEVENEVEQEQPKPSRKISQKVKDQVWRRDEGKCVECGNNEKLEFDHIIPHSKGGSNTYRNIQLLCEPCNRRKSASLG